MKTNKLALPILLSLAVVGCSSDEEKIREKQIEVCREDIKSGKEPTAFCTNLLPEYRAVAPVQQAQQFAPMPYAEPQQSAYQQAVQPQFAQPQIIQQAPAPEQGSGIDKMILGGLLGHAIGSSGNNSQGRTEYHGYVAPSRPTYVTKNVTINQRPAAVAPVPVPAPKPNYMDMSKLKAPIPTYSSPVKKPSAMNMSKLSSAGRRK